MNTHSLAVDLTPITDETNGLATFQARNRALVACQTTLLQWSYTSTGSWIDTGAEITTPNYAGETFTVTFEGAEIWATGGTANGGRLQNSISGAYSACISYATARGFFPIFAQTGVPANSLTWIDLALQNAGNTNYLYGTVIAKAYQESAW